MLAITKFLSSDKEVGMWRESNGIRDAGSTAEYRKLPLDSAAHWNFSNTASYVLKIPSEMEVAPL